MSKLTDLIDKYAPQIPVDWANHIAQGGIWSVLASLILAMNAIHGGHGLTPAVLTECLRLPFLGMCIVAGAKKLFDRIVEAESVGMCVGKALVTVLWPGSLYGLALLFQ